MVDKLKHQSEVCALSVVLQDNCGIVVFVLALGETAFEKDFPVGEEGFCNGAGKLLSLCFKEPAVFPQCKTTIAIQTEVAFALFNDRMPATRALAHNCSAVLKENICPGYWRVGLEHLGYKRGNGSIKLLWVDLAILNALQLLLPLSRLSCSAFCSQGIQTLLNKVTVRQSIVSTLNLHHCPGSVRPSGHWDPQTTLIRIPGLCTTHAPTQTPSHSPSTD